MSNSDGNIALIVIGTEILSAEIQETNAYPLLKKLNKLGYRVKEVRILADRKIEIACAVGEMAIRYSFVITSGGIGPTHDDITLEAIGMAFDLPLRPHAGMHGILTRRFKEIPDAILNKLILMPTESEVYEDGMHWPLIAVRNCFVLPGLPSALKQKLNRLSQILPASTIYKSAEVFLVCKEVEISEWLRALQKKYSTIDIGIYQSTKMSNWNCRITLRGQDQKIVEAFRELLAYTKGKRWFISASTNFEV